MAFKHQSRLLILFTVAAALFFVSAVPSQAEAQRRHRRSVVVVGGYAYYHHWMHDPWYQWGPWGPYGYPPYGYRYGARDLASSVRLEVTPRQAQVFVDGYYAGVVDEFDGVFQRLRVEPGGHTITLYLEGYRTETQDLYLRPGTDQRIRVTMQPLVPGERSEPPPPARDAAEDDEDVEDYPARTPDPRRGVGRAPERQVQPAPARFGTLSLRVYPADAEVLVDGQRWNGTTEQDRISIQLTEGRHRIEVRRAGLATYAEEVLIRRDRTLTLNVSLSEP